MGQQKIYQDISEKYLNRFFEMNVDPVFGIPISVFSCSTEESNTRKIVGVSFHVPAISLGFAK